MKKSKILAFLLYSLPVLFFVVSYFVMTVSGEDIFQGAGNYSNGVVIDVASDAREAFLHNGRLPDVYAWTVIDFFDYQFKFGLDVVFRLLDVVMAGGIFYLITLMVLGRKPKMMVRDALIFDASFAMIMLTQHGRVFYAGFSAIHNYMVAIFIMLLFCAPYVMELWGKKIMSRWWMIILMLVLGIVFGMSAAIPPIAFVLVGIVSMAIEWKKYKKTAGWKIGGLVGVLIGLFISNFLGPSLDFYTSNEIYVTTYDYVSMGDLLASPIDGIVKIVKHLVVNFGRVLVPLLVFGGLVLILVNDTRKVFVKKFWREMDKGRKKTLMVCGSFGILCVLGTFQVNAPLRVLLPAYVVGVMILLVVFEPYVLKTKILGWMVAIATSGVVITRLALAVDYHVQVAVVLGEIKNFDGVEMCVDASVVKAKNLPVLYLGQEDMLVDWAMPEVVYEKTVKFCK